MRRLLILTIAVLMCAGVAMAQGGFIGLYADAAGTECNVYDLPTMVVEIYVVHQFAPGATASEFKVSPVDGANMTWLSDSVWSPFLHLGNSQDGISIAYRTCYSSPINILTITYLAQGLSATCSSYRVVPDPTAYPAGEIWMTDCASPTPNLLPAGGGLIYVNPNASCTCIIPVEDTTWGGIKALYQ